MKKPEDETPTQMNTRRIFESVSNHATRSEKTAWERKRTNMEKLITQLRPLEDQIMEIRSAMRPIYDDITALRSIMVDECIHPYDMLVINESLETITCKFCEKTMKPVITLERASGTEEDL
jgi:small-conductance mechanosensitive channel